jgi:DNA-binding transcriptional MocR family regulator
LSGWISIHRKIQDNWIWEDKPFSKGQAWIDILLMVNHEDKKIPFSNELVEVKRGSRITSIRQLCDRWGWSNTKVRGFLKLLEDEKMLVIKSDSKKTTLTVVNYNDYQIIKDNENDIETTEKNRRNITEKSQKHTNNNDNNDNNDNKDIYTDLYEFWNSKEIIKHKKLTDKMKTKIKTTLKDYDVETLKEIISTYAEIVHDEKYYFTYKWSLEDFLQRGLKQFENSDIAKRNFLKKEFNKTSNQNITTKSKNRFHNFQQRSDNYTEEELDKKVDDIADRKKREFLERMKEGK